MAVMLVQGDARALPFQDGSVQCVVTSPPYFGLRDYGEPRQLGLESTPDAYVAQLVAVFREVRRALKDDGTLWLNLGDSYCGAGWSNHTLTGTGAARREDGGKQKHGSTALPGLKSKDLIGIPWRVAFALQADGWYLRSDIIWAKSNPMPESVTDRPTKAHEYVFLLTKSARYWYDADAIAERAARPEGSGNRRPYSVAHERPGRNANKGGSVHLIGPRELRNMRSVWTLTTEPYPGAHFATFPEALVEPCIKAGSRGGDLILDPFCGSGTVGTVAHRYGRRFVGVDCSARYLQMARERWHRSANVDQLRLWEWEVAT